MPPELLQLLQRLLAGGGGAAPQPTATPNILDIIKATEPDPVAAANRAASMPSYMPGSQSPFATGFFNPENRASSMSPEARLASQGNNAVNQWAQLGGNPGVDPFELARLTEAKKNVALQSGAPPRTGFGEIPQPEVAPVAAPQVGSWIPQGGNIFSLIGPKRAGEGGGQVLGQATGGAATAAPVPPGGFGTPAGNAILPPKKKKARGAFNFGAGPQSRPAFSF
jgi:hypothetical protein